MYFKWLLINQHKNKLSNTSGKVGWVYKKSHMQSEQKFKKKKKSAYKFKVIYNLILVPK